MTAETLSRIHTALAAPKRKPRRPRTSIADQPELPLRAWTPLGGQLYLHRNGQFYERVTIAGRRTFRALGTSHEKTARQTIASHQIAQSKAEAGAGPSPYEKQMLVTTGQVIEKYIQDGFPDRQRQPRPQLTRQLQSHNCNKLLPFWSTIPVEQVRLAAMDKYCDHRVKQIAGRSGYAGLPTVDQELGTLNSAFIWSVRCELVRYNPMSDRRPRYSIERNTKHCREFMPTDAEQLHDVARKLFSDPRSEALGWQYLLEAFTGLRTAEALQLRIDAPPGAPGHIITSSVTGTAVVPTARFGVPPERSEHSWKALDIGRAKNGCNPFVIMTPDLETLLRALFAWRAARYPETPWYIPSPRKFGESPLNRRALARGLARVSKEIGRKLTSHGARAYYVTARRSWGISDIQIAIEIGHRGGPGLLTTTYGGVPTNWLTGDGPKMTWLPATGAPAWTALNLESRDNILRLPTTKAA